MTVRVLHAPLLMGGHPQELVRAERALGLHSRAVSLTPTRFGFAIDEVLWRGDESLVAREAKRWRLVWRALRNYDVAHFNFGRSILPCASTAGHKPEYVHGGLTAALARAYARAVCQKDLWLLKRAGKAIFVTYQGDDARQGDYCRAHFPIHFANEVGADYYPVGSDEAKRRRIAVFDRFADGIYALNPDLLHVLPRRAQFLPYSNINPDDWRPVPPTGSSRKTVVHAPTHREVKGTRYVVEAMARLRAEGFAADLVLVEKQPHREARAAYGRADIVVDQLLAGWYGGLAVEALALGKPVVAYIRSEDLHFVPDRMREELPVVRAEPGTIYEVLRTLLSRPAAELSALGARGRSYVERWHHPRAIAQRLKSDYERALATH
ncbi:MAG: glycosyltransferase family 1 protein [Betaproteobacteria bacterium]|nr:glycosyltransferase family 1 protein [Betaproteobacteria bacterium]